MCSKLSFIPNPEATMKVMPRPTPTRTTAKQRPASSLPTGCGLPWSTSAAPGTEGQGSDAESEDHRQTGTEQQAGHQDLGGPFEGERNVVHG